LEGLGGREERAGFRIERCRAGGSLESDRDSIAAMGREDRAGHGLRTKKTTWDEIKASRGEGQQRRSGYEKAGRAVGLAREIRGLRSARGLSQRELAERLGTTQSAIARLEAGNISPSLHTLDRVAEALGAELTVTFSKPRQPADPRVPSRRSRRAPGDTAFQGDE
jgi:ribosome-binding protein aMBF1 (putative translation factor)